VRSSGCCSTAGRSRTYNVGGGKRVADHRDSPTIGREPGFVPAGGFASGIRKMLGRYLATEVWWRGVMDGSYRGWVARNYEGVDAR